MRLTDEKLAEIQARISLPLVTPEDGVQRFSDVIDLHSHLLHLLTESVENLTKRVDAALGKSDD